jgi:aminocarboxymuconate-semialdehyde decarboxylase
MLKIDVHAHILPRDWPNLALKYHDPRWPWIDHAEGRHRIYKDGRFFREIWPNTWDPELRIAEYAKHDVDVQVISTVPVMFSYWAEAIPALEFSRALNDHIASVCAAHPRHYAGLGTVPLQAPELAVRELERCVRELKLQGIQIGSHHGAINLDHPSLFPIFAAARDLGAAILVHPWEMMGTETMPKYWLPWLVGMSAEQARAFCCLVFGGVLERLPGLRVCFAHGGGAFPYTLGRIEHGWAMRPDLVQTDSKMSPREALKHVYVDSCVHDLDALRYLIDVMGAERVMLGTDYPFPLGEQIPGGLIARLGLDAPRAGRLFSETALEWLGMDAGRFADA